MLPGHAVAVGERIPVVRLYEEIIMSLHEQLVFGRETRIGARTHSNCSSSNFVHLTLHSAK